MPTDSYKQSEEEQFQEPKSWASAGMGSTLKVIGFPSPVASHPCRNLSANRISPINPAKTSASSA